VQPFEGTKLLRLAACLLLGAFIAAACSGGSDSGRTPPPTAPATSPGGPSAANTGPAVATDTPAPTGLQPSPSPSDPTAGCGGDPGFLTLDWALQNAPNVVVGRAGDVIESRVDEGHGYRTGLRIVDFTVDRIIASTEIAPTEHVRVDSVEWEDREECKTPGLLLDQGTTYLLFLDNRGLTPDSNEYWFYTELRFKVTQDGLLAPNGYESNPAAYDISQVSMAEINAAHGYPDRETLLASLARTPIWKAEQTVLAVLAAIAAATPTPAP
jgi:hypothetical protein